MEDRTLLSTFLVSNTADSGPGSLRQAILDSDAATSATNTIDFNISGSGVQTIAPLSSLPTITNPVLIDGESQPGYAGTPLIELSGTQAGTGDGLTITAPNVTVRGLEIDSFSQGAGIHLTGTGATGDWIYGNFLGTDPTGTQALPNNEGVEIDAGAAKNLIGTNGDGVNDTAERNIISGNLFTGVWITGQGTNDNAVAGNFIGTSVSGDVALDNGASPVYYPYSISGNNYGSNIGGGIVIQGAASGNRIGTDGQGVDDVGERNVVAGSGNDGIDIVGAGTDGNIVAGNFIGTDVTGKLSLGVANNGVFLSGGASSNWIGVNPDGGTAFGDEGNVISGNGQSGVEISLHANANDVAGDRIGTDATGAVALGNSVEGVLITKGSGNTIGGTTAGAADVVSGNGSFGVELDNIGSAVPVGLSGSSDNLVEGDFIGTDVTGTIALGNAAGGVLIGDATSNTIGGATAVAGNLITDNGGTGVAVTEVIDTSNGNQITANRIFGNAGQAIDLGGDGVTYNAASPRIGPNNLQNFPIIVMTADGRLQGWLGGSLPNSTFRIDDFASSAYGPGGAGEAEDYLGSQQVTTDSRGQVVFDVPYTPTAGVPLVTATATDPQGNTSEVSALRQATFRVLPPSIRVLPDRALSFSTTSDDAIAIQDPDAGPLDPSWNLTLSVGAGTLTLGDTTDLTGSGDGTGSLSYSGSLAAIEAALAGLRFTPPSGFQGDTTLSMGAQSDGAAGPVQAQVSLLVTDGLFRVTTTADSGPGSLRQAILDSNAATGGTNTIDFALPGTGLQTIAPITPLPPITNPVLIDGTTEPGFAGMPLIAFGGPQADPAPLVVSSGNVTIRGLALGSLVIDPTSSDRLIAVLDAPGGTSRLSLLDAGGKVLVQNDGVSPDSAVHSIDEHLAPGEYSLAAESLSGPGTYNWTVILTRAIAPFQGNPTGAIGAAGDFNGDGKLDLAVSNGGPVSILLGNGDGTFQLAGQYAAGTEPDSIVAGDFTGDGHLDLAVANYEDGTMSVLLGNGDGTFQPATQYGVGLFPSALVTGDFTGNGHLDLAVAYWGNVGNGGQTEPAGISVLLGNGDGTFALPVQYATGAEPKSIVAGDFTGNGHVDLAVADIGNVGNGGTDPGGVYLLLGNGNGTFHPEFQR
jgi:hypothetical protein